MDGNLFCHTPVQYKDGLFFSFFWFVSLLISKRKHLLQQKRAVEAAKSNRLHSHCIEIRLQKIRSQRCRSLKLRLFYMLFLENEVQTD